MNSKTTDIGVIVGRFQTPRLTEAHIDLIETVCKKHAKVIIFLGLSPIVATKNNPLDYEARKRMIQERFNDVTILYVNDNPSDEVWSANLDRMLADSHLTGPSKSITLYGSRDSFLKGYHGKHNTEELIPETTVSATELRRISGNRVKGTVDFREGVIWATQNRYPSTFPTVDIGIVDKNTRRILFGRKPNSPNYCFVGGFADPEDLSFEHSAAREVLEETNLAIPEERFHYVGSTKINDWRYRAEEDKIKTILFLAEYTIGEARAGDDLAETKWFSLDLGADLKKYVSPNHHVLLDMLLKHLGND